MNVLVTGATTPLGAALVRALLDLPDTGHVVAVGVDPWRRELPPRGPRFSYIQTDLTHRRAIRSLLGGPLRAVHVDAIVHTALHRALRASGRRVHRLNVDATRALVELAAHHPTVRHFVYRSYAEIYHVAEDAPCLVGEDHPLELAPDEPQWVRDRAEADLTVCSHVGDSALRVVVLRCAELFAPHSGSQLYDYVRSRVCLRPIGYDPMLNLLSMDDAVRAHLLALGSAAGGVFNIPGWDTLPLSRLVALTNRVGVPLPGPILRPLYRLRRRLVGTQFSYRMNAPRLHLGGVLDGTRAREELGYEPRVGIAWDDVRRALADEHPRLRLRLRGARQRTSAM
jgi:UDP-glucose 4-epimerase